MFHTSPTHMCLHVPTCTSHVSLYEAPVHVHVEAMSHRTLTCVHLFAHVHRFVCALCMSVGGVN